MKIFLKETVFMIMLSTRVGVNFFQPEFAFRQYPFRLILPSFLIFFRLIKAEFVENNYHTMQTPGRLTFKHRFALNIIRRVKLTIVNHCDSMNLQYFREIKAVGNSLRHRVVNASRSSSEHLGLNQFCLTKVRFLNAALS
jgi:hypothetical protein